MDAGLADAELALMADLFERKGQQGAPSRYERLLMVEACRYAMRASFAPRLLPNTFPPWRTTRMSCSRWTNADVFKVMYDHLRQQWRDRMGRSPEPTTAVIDAQCRRSTAQRSSTGFDASKKVKGRWLDLVGHTLGLLLAVTVTAASA